MKLRPPSGRFIAAGLGLGVVIAAALATAGMTGRNGAGVPAAAAAPDPATAPAMTPAPAPAPSPAAPSCKPVAPVQITLVPDAAPGLWRIGIDALAAAEAVVTLREDSGPERVVWRGTLAQGEHRDVVVTHAVARTATLLRAEVAVQETAQFVSRAGAAVAVVGGRPAEVTAAASRQAGRLVVDPRDGSSVLELPGAGGSR